MSQNARSFRWWGSTYARVGVESRSRQENRRRLRPGLLELEPRRLLSTFMVTNKSDNPHNTHSLRYAVNHEPSGTVINFAPGLTGTITLTHGYLDVEKNLVIQGPGQGKLTISANNNSRVFNITEGVKLTLSSLTLANGSTDGDGGGIYNYYSTLTMKNCTVEDCAAGYAYYGGGLYNYYGTLNLTNCTFSNDTVGEGGGGVSTEGTATLTNCTFVDDSAFTRELFDNPAGGGLYNDGTVHLAGCTFTDDSSAAAIPDLGNGDGGAMYNEDNAFLTNCTFDGNTVLPPQAAKGNGGAFYADGASQLTGCTFSNNSANFGGGLYVGVSGSLTMTNCTVADNTAGAGYGDSTGGGLFDQYDSGPVNVTSCTFSGNSAEDTGGGMEIDDGLTILNTIVAGNTAPSGAPDIYAFARYAVDSAGYNLIGNSNDSGSGWVSTDLLDNNAQPLNLGPLASNGGPTQTMAVLPGSAAIGHGTVANGAPSTDQRGVGGPGGSPDIGAFQDRGFKIAVVPGHSPQSAKINSFFAKPLAVLVTSPSGDPVAGGSVTWNAPTSGPSATLVAVSLSGSPANSSTLTAKIGSNGRAAVGALANGTTGHYSVTATSRGATTTAFLLSNRLTRARIARLVAQTGTRPDGVKTPV